MAATHRFSGSRLDLHTSLAPEQVAGISKRVGDGTKGNIRIGVNHVRFEGASPGRTVFSIRALGDAWELMVFHVAITADGADSSVRTGIDSFKTAQRKMYGIIPTGPKSLSGYKTYKLFMHNLADAITAQDSSARSQITEVATI
jgi:hypothetical protein